MTFYTLRTWQLAFTRLFSRCFLALEGVLHDSDHDRYDTF
jgi:hypothetical protein